MSLVLIILEVVSSYKYLGFVISSNLSWSKHVGMTDAKASRVLGLITWISGGSQSFSHRRDVLLRLYKGLCLPIIEYGAPVWQPHHIRHIRSIERIQHKLTRIIFNGRSTSYTDRLTHLDIPSLHSILLLLSFTFVCKCLYMDYITYQYYILYL